MTGIQTDLFDGVPTPMELRDYQRDCLNALAQYRRDGGARALVVLPTGLGKTVIFSQVPKYAKGKVLVVAHREELIQQAADKIHQANPFLDIQVEQAASRAGKAAQVIVASIQTLISGERLRRFRPEDFSSVIVDEAHHVSARSYIQVLGHFGLAPDVVNVRWATNDGEPHSKVVREAFDGFSPEAGTPYLMGFTATPGRSDGRGLDAIFDEIVFARDMREMMDAGWICPIKGIRVSTATDISDVETRRGDYAEKELASTVNTPERNLLAASAYLEHAKGRQALVFCVDVQHTIDMTTAFKSKGINVDYVVGALASDDRKGVVNAYRRGDLKVLVNCMVLSEGFDAPNTSAIVMARPTKSSLLYTQQLGRGTRLAPGKGDLLVIDLVDVARKSGVANLNTLFGLPPNLKLRPGQDIAAARKRFDELEARIPQAEFEGIEDLDQAGRIAQKFDPLRQSARPGWLEAGSRLAWAPTPFGLALGLFGRAQLGIIEDKLGHATIRYKRTYGERGLEIGRAASLVEAVAMADTWLGERMPEAFSVLDKGAGWRRQQPSEKQLAMLQRLRVPIPAGLTKGQASDILNTKMARR